MQVLEEINAALAGHTVFGEGSPSVVHIEPLDSSWGALVSVYPQAGSDRVTLTVTVSSSTPRSKLGLESAQLVGIKPDSGDLVAFKKPLGPIGRYGETIRGSWNIEPISGGITLELRELQPAAS